MSSKGSEQRKQSASKTNSSKTDLAIGKGESMKRIQGEATPANVDSGADKTATASGTGLEPYVDQTAATDGKTQVQSQALPDAQGNIKGVVSSSCMNIESQEPVDTVDEPGSAKNDPAAFNPSSSQALSQPLGEGGDDEPVGPAPEGGIQEQNAVGEQEVAPGFGDMDDVQITDDHPEIVPNSQPPQVPAEGTYIDAMNEAGIDPRRIEQLQQSKLQGPHNHVSDTVFVDVDA